MATNDFLPFASAAGSNVMAQSDYAGLTARSTGFTAGVAQSVQLNKVWRQSSLIAAVVAQFISDNTGINSVDDGTIATLEANLALAISSVATAKHVSAFAVSGTFTVPAGVTKVRATVVGGGGGGSSSNQAQIVPGQNFSSGGGGGAGGLAIGIYTVTPGQAITITIGAGGASQSNGGTSSFGALCSATGGSGSVFQTSIVSPGAFGGQGTGGTILNLAGGCGADGQGGAYVGYGNGAPGPWGGGGKAYAGGTGNDLGPANGRAFGAGGGGSYSGAAGTNNGGVGAPGVVILEY